MKIRKVIGQLGGKARDMVASAQYGYSYNVKPKAQVKYSQTKKVVVDAKNKAGKASKKVGDYAERVNRNTQNSFLISGIVAEKPKKRKQNKRSNKGKTNQTIIIIKNSERRKKKKRSSTPRQRFSLI